MPVARRSRKVAPRFSVVTMVRNEARRLPRLIESLSEFRERGGEILVLDTGSEDGTPELARSAGCRVVVEPRRFNGRLSASRAGRLNEAFCRAGEGPFFQTGQRLFDYGRARSHAASLARHDFQLAVDGADVVETMDIDALDAAVQSKRSPLMGFQTRIRTRAGWLLEIREYFYDRKRTAWKGRAHNFVSPASSRPGSSTELLDPRQLRVSHHTDFEKARDQQLAGAAIEALADPSSHRWRYFLGRDLGGRRAHRSAMELLLGLDQADVPASVRSAALCLAAQNLSACGASTDEVDTLLFRASRRDSTRRDPLLQLAARRSSAGEMQGAASFAAAALSIPPRPGFSEPEENQSVRPHAILYWALLWLGRRDEARRHFDACRELDPQNPAWAEHARLFDA